MRGRLVAGALVAASVAIFVDERVVDATWPALLASSPLGLALATGHLPQLLLASARLPTDRFAAVVALHAAIATAVGYATGRRLGEPAVLRLLGRLGTARAADRALGTARRVGLPLLVIAPALSVSLLVGAADTAATRVALAVVAAICLRVVALSALGHAFAHPLLSVLDWVTRFQWPLVGLSAAAVVTAVTTQRRRTRR